MASDAVSWPDGLVSYVVGLDSDCRGGPLEAQLAGEGLTVERADAFDAGELDEELLAQYVDQEAARFVQHPVLSAGEVGCAVSHQRVWRDVVNSGALWTLVFEDDARLAREFRDLHVVLEALPEDRPCILLLGYMPDYTVTRTRTGVPIEGTRRNLYRAATPAPGTHAYAINRLAATLALSRSGGRISSVADWPASWAYDVQFYVVTPALAVAGEDLPSTLQSARGKFEESFETRVEKLLRHVESVLLARYARARHLYPGLRQFWAHEVIRPTVLTIARRRRRSLAGDERRPWALGPVSR